MKETDWAGRNKQMGEVALPEKFSAKKYDDETVATTATYCCSLSAGCSFYSTVHISAAHNQSHSLFVYIFKKFKLVCSCIHKSFQLHS